MKKNVKLLSLMLGILMLCITVMPVSAMAAAPADEGENYVDIVDPLSTRASPLTKTFGTKFNAYLSPYQTTGTTNQGIVDWTNASVPSSAVVTRVEVQSYKTNVPGMTYYVQIGRGPSAYSFTWAPNILWASTVTTHYFDGLSPQAYWAVQFYVTRVITTTPDYGAGATVSNVTLRVYYA